VPIRAFGIFASVIVPVNYIMVILMMPSVMMIYERDIKNCLPDTIKRLRGTDIDKKVKTKDDPNQSYLEKALCKIKAAPKA